jgi:hypothetical protein
MIIKKSDKKPKISFILLDWNCRESFHIFDYFKNQTIDSSQYEIMWVEYYKNRPKELEDKDIDQWIIMGMEDDFYYHKHLMYNVGIFHARGDIVVIMDSDVMLKPTFVETILKEFEENENLVLHLDEFRNINPKYYPFNYLSFDDFMNDGCKNEENGFTTGISRKYEPIHNLNYGACFCAKKDDLIKIGGADEHIDYLGHICGPYELTFRLENLGRETKWSKTEFLYHTWHPGSDGVGNYLGPHDGKNVSTRSLELLDNQRVEPYKFNEAILGLQNGLEDENLLLKNATPQWSIKNLG